MKAFMSIFSKEILSFLRSIGLVAVVLYAFSFDIYIAGNGIQVKPRNVSIGYVDYSGGIISKKILLHLHKPEFKKPIPFKSQKALSDAIFNKEIMVGIVFDSDFEKNIYKKRVAKINVLIDSTAASQAYVTLSYLQNIIMNMSNIKFPIDLAIHKLFNQNSNSKWFMSFTELLSVITLLGVILTAMVFVKEKEDGTWDIMLLMPVDSKLIIFAKIISQVIILLGGVIIAFGFVIFEVFNAPMNGSIFDFLILTLLYSITAAGIGLFIAAISESALEVGQYAMLIMMPLIFLSGAWTPIYAMHPALQFLSLFSPLRYYIEGSESIMFRGADMVHLWKYYAALLFLGIILFWYGYRKMGRLF